MITIAFHHCRWPKEINWDIDESDEIVWHLFQKSYYEEYDVISNLIYEILVHLNKKSHDNTYDV